MTFHNLEVDPRLLGVLDQQGILSPTPVQSEAIPIALTGQDLVAIAQTGTGKTLAFGLPALHRIAADKRPGTRILILAPTRELAQQVHDVLAPLAKAVGLASACIYGGVGMDRQATALRRGVALVVATPGRLLDHMGRRNTRFENVAVSVLDEADRMLDMGFLPDIKRILSALPAERQTLMFSATFPNEIARLTTSMLRDPARVEVGAVAKPADAVTQFELLAEILRRKDVGSTVVFLRTKRATDRVAEGLQKRGFAAESIHGDHSQGQRQRAIEGFRRGKHQILVATDVAARGLDVQGISHVVNYDIPASSDDYIHRIGRTARASATGEAITFVSPGESLALRAIERAIGRPIERVEWDGAVEIGPSYDPNLKKAPAFRGARGGGRRRSFGPRVMR